MIGAQKFQAVGPRHVYIGEHEAIAGGGEHFDGLGTIERGIHEVTFEPQKFRQGIDDQRIIIHDQQPRGGQGAAAAAPFAELCRPGCVDLRKLLP